MTEELRRRAHEWAAKFQLEPFGLEDIRRAYENWRAHPYRPSIVVEGDDGEPIQEFVNWVVIEVYATDGKACILVKIPLTPEIAESPEAWLLEMVKCTAKTSIYHACFKRLRSQVVV